MKIQLVNASHMYLINNNFIQKAANDVHVNNNNVNQFQNHHNFSIINPSSNCNNLNTNLNHNNNIRNSASYNCIVTNKHASSNVPHYSATNLTTTNNQVNQIKSSICSSCKNHHSSVNKLSNSNQSLTNATASSTNNIYNRNKLEQSLLEAKLRVAQLKKELQSSSSKIDHFLNNNNASSQDQVDFGMSRQSSSYNQLPIANNVQDSKINMLKNYMQEAVESVCGSQNNSRHSSQQLLPTSTFKQAGLSSSASTADSLRNSASSIYLNNPYLQINHHNCNHQISTSDSCTSITDNLITKENIYSNQQIINNLNKSKSANTINQKTINPLEQSVHDARQRVIQLKKELENHQFNNQLNSENHAIYSNQSAIIAQQQLELSSQKINNQDLLNIIDKYYRKNDSSAVEV